MSFLALYRKYRPQKFAEVVGQEHIVKALQNAVSNERVGHAYLFSGPRGTGKTSMARILAKALNCERPENGEPCGECNACEELVRGASYDLQELDAASNNGVDAMRDLISMVALAPLRKYRVYVIDEVHMLSSGAENALLKTLEEPPPYVIFIMCTTEPHKVVETVRSRAQHLEFGLIERKKLKEHLEWVIKDADLSLTATDLEYVLDAGKGSARDALSAMDRVAAVGEAPVRRDLAHNLVEAIVVCDTQMAVQSVADCAASGGELRILARQAIESLRSAFLHSVGVEQEELSDEDRARAENISSRIKLPRIVNMIELLGDCMATMRSSPDPRVDLEVALIKATRVDNEYIQTQVEDLLKIVSELETKMNSKAFNPEAAASEPEDKPENKPEAEIKPDVKNEPEAKIEPESEAELKIEPSESTEKKPEEKKEPEEEMPDTEMPDTMTLGATRKKANNA